MVAAELVGLDALLRALEDAANEGVAAAVERAAELTAEAARRDHPYTDRTGDLTASLEGVPASGVFLDGTLQSAAVAGTDYAQYVNERPEFEFLQPAWDAVEPLAEQEAERLLDDAAKRHGL